MLSYICGMKAFFDITLPTSWASLTDRQLRYAYRQIARGLSLPAITALCLLKWGQLQVKFQHPKGTYHTQVRDKKIFRKVPIALISLRISRPLQNS